MHNTYGSPVLKIMDRFTDMTNTPVNSPYSDLALDEIRSYRTIDSTNRAALDWANENVPDMSLVTAIEQTAGRGRMQRKWITAPNSSVAMSLIIRPTETEKPYQNFFSPLAGLAVAESLRDYHYLQPQIKWPNDILLEGKKVCGILCESVWAGDQLNGLVLGIGMNVLAAAIPPVENQNFPAGSLETAGCICLEPEQHIHDIIRKIISLRPLITSPEFIQRWETFLAFKNRLIQLTAPGKEPERCMLIGLDAQGNLLVSDQNGQEKSYMAGEISLRPVEKPQG